MKGIWVPVLILLGGLGLAALLATQHRAVPVTATGQPAIPIIAQPQPGQEQAYPGRNSPAPGPELPAPPGSTVRSLDKINAAAKAVGCPTLEMGDPAVKIFDVAECLGKQAVARRATP